MKKHDHEEFARFGLNEGTLSEDTPFNREKGCDVRLAGKRGTDLDGMVGYGIGTTGMPTFACDLGLTICSQLCCPFMLCFTLCSTD